MYKSLILIILTISISPCGFAQKGENKADTFFLAKKKGILGKLGRSIARSSPPSAAPIKSEDPFKKYNGKIIRFIEVVPVGFNQNLNDTTEIRRNLAIRVANRFHKTSRNATIRRNLFFNEGDVFLPLLVADNERYLRSLPYLRDAVIVVYQSIMSKDSVDIIVLTKDVFSIGGNFSTNGTKRTKSSIREENLMGTGTKLALSGFYDRNRKPKTASGIELTERNLFGSFISGTAGYKTFKNAVLSDRYEEQTFFIQFEKPLVNRYTDWTGALYLSHNQSVDAYLDSLPLYEYTSQYRYDNIDIWGGYNIGWKRKRTTDSEKRLRHFVSARAFYNYFYKVPTMFKDSFNYNFANRNGAIFSYTLYKQNFYVTNFIYGFGRNEDVPIGLTASITAGWTNIQNRLRGYYGAEFNASSYSKKGFFSSYIARVGAFRSADKWEDISLLLSVDHFTKLHKITNEWFNRNFISVSYTRLFKQKLNEPIRLTNDFGIPYFRADSLNILEFNSRATFKLESVFFNMHKFLGFRFAPFLFTQISLLQPTVNPGNKTENYGAFGAGVRTKNENLVIGTLELRGFYFPKLSTAQMSRWKIVITTNLRPKYNAVLLKRPDFSQVNY